MLHKIYRTASLVAALGYNEGNINSHVSEKEGENRAGVNPIKTLKSVNNIKKYFFAISLTLFSSKKNTYTLCAQNALAYHCKITEKNTLVS